MAKKAKTEKRVHIPNPEDVALGAKVRVRRIEQRMSQTDLAQALGVTFQQVQKYEKGTNRIASSRLKTIAEVLDIEVNFFMESTSKNESNLMALVMDKASQRMLVAFSKLKDGPMRQKFVGLLEQLTDKAA